jgi:hypothetical protein
MSQIVLLGSLTQVFVLRLQHVTPGQSLSVVQAAVEVAVAVVLWKDVKDSTMVVVHHFLAYLVVLFEKKCFSITSI